MTIRYVRHGAAARARKMARDHGGSLGTYFLERLVPLHDDLLALAKQGGVMPPTTEAGRAALDLLLKHKLA